MINILPIKSVREEDQDLFGELIVKLAKLAHHKLPVEDGLVVASPFEQIEKIFLDLKISSGEEFEINKEKFGTKFFEMVAPEGFSDNLLGKGIDPKAVWQKLLKAWFELIESKIYRGGFNEKGWLHLPGQVVLFAASIAASGRAFYDRLKKEVLVKMDAGELKFEDGMKLDQIVIEAEKVLHLPYIYSFIIDQGEVKLTKVTPFTDRKFFDSEVETLNPKPKQEIKVNLNKRAVKLFLEIEKGFVTDSEVDGFIFNSNPKEDFDQKTFRFSELAASYQTHPVIFSFGETLSHEDGSFRDSLEENAKVFLFARNKKRLLNTQIALPAVSSIESFMQVKRDLSSLGILRKASLKFWMKAAVPENLIMLENYLTGGFDGMIINLDELAKNLSGGEEKINSKTVHMLEKFIEEPLKILSKASVPVIALGKAALDHQLLERLVHFGVYGIAIDSEEGQNTRENIKTLEQSHKNLVS